MRFLYYTGLYPFFLGKFLVTLAELASLWLCAKYGGFPGIAAGVLLALCGTLRGYTFGFSECLRQDSADPDRKKVRQLWPR